MIRNRLPILAIVFPLLFLSTSCTKPVSPKAQSSSVEAATATPIDPATVATISGVVHFDGPVPPAKKIDMSADSSCKGQNQAETVLVNDGRLANVMVYVKDGLGGRSFPAPSDKVTIAQEGCRYVPHVAAVMVGQPVEFLDTDDTLHNVHGVPKNNAQWNQSEMPNGGQFERKFTAAEVMIPVKCNQHPWMKMYLNVHEQPVLCGDGKGWSLCAEGPAARHVHDCRGA